MNTVSIIDTVLEVLVTHSFASGKTLLSKLAKDKYSHYYKDDKEIQ
jgi:hypothetical protein